MRTNFLRFAIWVTCLTPVTARAALVEWNPPGSGGTSVDGLYTVTNTNDGLALNDTDFFSNNHPVGSPVSPFTPGFPLGDAVGIGANSVVNYGPIDVSFPSTTSVDIHVLSLDGMALEFDINVMQNSSITPTVLSSVHMRSEAFAPVSGVYTYGDDALPGDQTANNEFQAAAGTIRFTSSVPFTTLRFDVIPGYNSPDNGDGANLAITQLVPEPSVVFLAPAAVVMLRRRVKRKQT